MPCRNGTLPKGKKALKYISQFGIIIAVSFIGEVLHTVIPVPIPASVYGIFLLFGLLESKVLKAKQVRETARFFIEIMPVLFIAPVVSMIDQWDVMKTIFIPFFVISIGTTILVMVLSGRLTQTIIRLDRRRKERAGTLSAASAAAPKGTKEGNKDA